MPRRIIPPTFRTDVTSGDDSPIHDLRERGFFCAIVTVSCRDMVFVAGQVQGEDSQARQQVSDREAVMLVLSRKRNQTIVIGDEVRVTVLKVVGNTVKIGIEAAPEISIMREELAVTLLQTDAARTERQVALQTV